MESNNIELITRMVIQAINQNEKKGDGFMVPIGVSARHIHLTQEHVEALFGPGYQLTKKKELMGGQFASNETVTIVGLKLRAIENVRILGPVRKASQVEVSATDAIKLGMNVPVRESGDVAGSAPIAIVGPKGAVYLKEGCIVAMRHIHMSPKDAQAAGVKDGDIVSVKADNERGTIFNHGILQSIFEYQTMICNLTGMDVSNACVYDGAEAAAEGVAMCQERKRKKAFVSAAILPDALATIHTYCHGNGMEIVEIPEKDGVTDLDYLKENIDEQTACVYIQHPNYYGNLEDAQAIGEIAHGAGAKYIMGVNPISLGIIKTPAEYGADVAVGDGQPL